jgi:hypothetical protein
MSDTIRRFPIYLLVDCSGSMVGDPIESVKSAIGAVHDELMNTPNSICKQDTMVWRANQTFTTSGIYGNALIISKHIKKKYRI